MDLYTPAPGVEEAGARSQVPSHGRLHYSSFIQIAISFT
jgi:hypothetical protein